ncbi:MAG: diguanylate cyclase, partial [Cyanobacteria bacterium J06648_11]
IQLRWLAPDLSATAVEAIANSALPCLQVQDSLTVACHLMQQLDFEELPVVDGRGTFVGTVSFLDALGALDPQVIFATVSPVASSMAVLDSPRVQATSSTQYSSEEAETIEELKQRVMYLTGELTAVKRQLAGEREMRQQMERSLYREQDLMQIALQSIDDAAIVTDAEGRVQFLNVRAERALGYASAEVTNRPIEDILDTYSETGHMPSFPPIREVMRDRTAVKSSAPLLLRSRDGSDRAIDYSVSAIYDRELLGSIFIFRDVSPSRQLTQQLTYETQHDALTGLTNRREFKRCLEAAIASARTDRYNHVLFYIDLDQFKIVNDTCGHGAGDELLRQLAQLLRDRIRLTDVLARLGGDEFGLLLHNCPLRRAQQLAHTLREQIAAYQFCWQDMVFSVAASIGIVAIDESTEELAFVLGAADAACYAAKEKGRNRIQLYQVGDRDLERQRSERQWVARLEKALADNRFCLFAQAIA